MSTSVRADVMTPVARRMTPPSWRDTRLVVGVLLVLVATVLGARLVSVADDREPFYAAAVSLRPGQPLSADSLVRVQAHLGEAGSAYLSAASPPPVGAFAARELRAGELVPLSAIVDSGAITVSPVTVEVDSLSTATLVVGSVVDVYVSPRDESSSSERYVEPRRTLERVTVSWLPEDSSRFGGPSATSTVSLLVPTDTVTDLLAETGQGSRVTLVPVPGSALKSGS